MHRFFLLSMICLKTKICQTNISWFGWILWGIPYIEKRIIKIIPRNRNRSMTSECFEIMVNPNFFPKHPRKLNGRTSFSWFCQVQVSQKKRHALIYNVYLSHKKIPAWFYCILRPQPLFFGMQKKTPRPRRVFFQKHTDSPNGWANRKSKVQSWAQTQYQVLSWETYWPCDKWSQTEAKKKNTIWVLEHQNIQNASNIIIWIYNQKEET